MFNLFTDALGELLDSVLGAVMVAVNALLYLINTWIYKMITPLYNMFDTLCNSRILDAEVIESLTDRISVVLGIVMFFIVTISFVQMMLEPDNLTDKEKGAGNIIKKIIIVIVLLGAGPFAFNLFYKVQSVVLESHVISKFLLPYEVDTEQFGGVLASELFTSFYHLNSDVEEELKTNGNIKDFEQSEMDVKNANCANVVSNLKKDIIKNNSFDIGLQCMNASINIDGEKIDYIDYNPIVMTLCGIFAVYILFSYCITVGVRTVQLAFLEVISPMAFISYLSPKKDTMFEKWWKVYFATYLDVFIRVMIINFVVFLVAIIFSSDQGWAFFDTLGGDTLLVKVIMVLALLSFAKKAPELLKDIFPTGAAKLGYGVNSPSQFFSGMLGGAFVMGAAKMATIGTTMGAIGAFNSARSRYKMNMKDVDKNDHTKLAEARKKALLGAAGGAFMAYGRGLATGATSKGNVFKNIGASLNKQKEFDDKYDNLITSGGDPKGRLKSKLTSYYGETQGQEFTRKIKNNQDFVDAYKKIDDLAESFLEVKKYKGLWQNAQARGESDEVVQMHFDNYKAVKQAMITSSIQDNPDYKYEVQLKTVWEDRDGKKFIVDNDPRAIEKGEMDVKSLASASQIQVDFADIKNLIDTGRVQLSYKKKNADGHIETVVIDKNNMKALSTASDLDKASAAASTAISDIKKTPGYSAAIANDRAAGVDSSATTNK